jgi:hypothetical protein
MPKQPKRDRTKDLAEELDVLDTMLSSLVELLEEKGVLTQGEYENRIKQKSERAMGLTSYRDVQFKKK